MLTGKQRRYLRSLAHHEKPIFQVGKSGVNDHMTTQISEALEKRELLKVGLLQNCMEDKHTVAHKLSNGTGSDIVQIIGHNIILYKESQDNKHIHLPSRSQP
ncbi:ribosome assembly RNA-binding protein YhbY [Lentibacillus halophilus]|uniref:Ribosome assembly RNA-binding protein YhbY n=1 Tax=Lentibacillus halophilus TaxID=295065 RepID=A0ABP3J5W0_9BACI